MVGYSYMLKTDHTSSFKIFNMKESYPSATLFLLKFLIVTSNAEVDWPLRILYLFCKII
jgi:hypothetical protein